MNAAPQGFPEYGHGGDHIGARRVRWAFRLAVAGCVFFTCALWIAEYFLSVDRAESLYISALTKETESARALLRNAVRKEDAPGATPDPRFVQALAEREEDDLVIAAYERAYRLDPGNASLAIRFGCRLFHEGKYPEARSRFQEAARTSSRNALPNYLEAATLPWTGTPAWAVKESLRLVAQTNSSGRHVTFPRPLWHAKLPQRGKRYEELRRRNVDETCAPLYRYTDFVVQQSEEQIRKKQVQYWDLWLEKVQEMGERIALGSLRADLSSGFAPGGAPQALVGLHIQLAALRQRERVHEIENGGPNEEFITLRVELENALRTLRDFENTRDERIALDETAFAFPLKHAALGFLALLAAYLLSYLASKVLGGGRSAWTIPHKRSCFMVLGAGMALLLMLLFAAPWSHRSTGYDPFWHGLLHGAWWTIIAAIAAGGVLYPAWRLPAPGKVLGGIGDPSPESTRAAGMGFRRAYISLIRRYFGLATGLLLLTVCAWVIGYRVIFSLYPWQLELLTTGLAEEEALVVQQVLALLR